MSATFELTIAVDDRCADLAIAELGSLEEVADELRDLAESTAARASLVVDFRTKERPAVALPEAMGVLVGIFTSAPNTLRIVCLFGNERARATAVRATAVRYLPGAQAPTLQGQIGGLSVMVSCGNIANACVDAVVNASNTRLVLGGGVSGAIRQASKAPGALQRAMLCLAPIDTSEAVTTSSYGLPGAKKIIHVATAAGTSEGVEACLRALFAECESRRVASVAIPALGTGAGSLSLLVCAELTLRAITLAAHSQTAALTSVHLMLYTGLAYEVFATACQAHSEFEEVM